MFDEFFLFVGPLGDLGLEACAFGTAAEDEVEGRDVLCWGLVVADLFAL